MVTLRIVRDLQSRLSFTEEEMKEYKMKNSTSPDGRVSITWDEDFNKETKDIEIGEVATGIIVKELKKLDAQQRLKMEAISLYEKFIEEKKVTQD